MIIFRNLLCINNIVLRQGQSTLEGKVHFFIKRERFSHFDNLPQGSQESICPVLLYGKIPVFVEVYRILKKEEKDVGRHIIHFAARKSLSLR